MYVLMEVQDKDAYDGAHVYLLPEPEPQHNKAANNTRAYLLLEMKG